jgi:transcriptional regulator with XRE-family HTH domain
MALPTHERIKYWREKLELTQEQLGERCEMTQYKISRIETGSSSDWSVQDLEAIVVRGLKMTMAEFYRTRAA